MESRTNSTVEGDRWLRSAWRTNAREGVGPSVLEVHQSAWGFLMDRRFKVLPDQSLEHRNERIAAMFCSGKTLEECGQAFGLTRERCRQIVKKFGMVGKDGGRAKRDAPKREENAKKQAEAAERRRRRDIERRCSVCREVKPLEQFARNSSNARGRSYRCNPCNARYVLERYHDPSTGMAEKLAAWQRANKDKTREYHRRWYRKKKLLASKEKK